MRTPADFRPIRHASRAIGSQTADGRPSAAAVFQDVGVVLAVFLGLAVILTAALSAFGLG